MFLKRPFSNPGTFLQHPLLSLNASVVINSYSKCACFVPNGRRRPPKISVTVRISPSGRGDLQHESPRPWHTMFLSQDVLAPVSLSIVALANKIIVCCYIHTGGIPIESQDAQMARACRMHVDVLVRSHRTHRLLEAISEQTRTSAPLSCVGRRKARLLNCNCMGRRHKYALLST